MSSGNLVLPNDRTPYLWSEGLDRNDFVFATYRIAATCPGESAAVAMAMEQSASMLSIRGYVTPDMLRAASIRVCAVRPVEERHGSEQVDPFRIDTEVYDRAGGGGAGGYEVILAVPAELLSGKPAQLLNVLVGELPRLGFLTRFRLEDVVLPPGFGPGPGFGAEGILDLLGLDRGPVLCRAMRPGVGLSTEVMAALNRDVLIGGFHMVKDDELIVFRDAAAFGSHVRAMIAARDEAIRRTGERKLYMANLFCEPGELEERWALACDLGVDAVLVAPSIQGMGILAHLAARRKMPLLAHNSVADFFARNPSWGISDRVLCRWYRHLGADWFVTPGPFATPGSDPAWCRELIDVASGSCGGLRGMMPNLQGGKHPAGLPIYREAVGSDRFTLIVAHWVDTHPAGLIEAAGEFRRALR